MNVVDLVALVGSLAAGFIGKKAGNSKVTGPQPWGKVLGPLAAAAGAIAITAILGVELDVQTIFRDGGETGATAIMLHTVLKNMWQLLQSLRAKA